MDFGNRAPFAARDVQETSPTRASSSSSSSFNGSSYSSPDDYSYRASSKRSFVAHEVNHPKSHKKKRFADENQNSVVLYNIPPRTDRETLKDFIDRMFLQMHATKARIVQCLCISNVPATDPLTYIVNFETAELVELAISLNGVEWLNQTIYASSYDPDWTSDTTHKMRLCYNYCCGNCVRGNTCRHAHGVLDLKLYHKTVLSENRTIYITQIPFRFAHVLGTVRKRFKNHGILPFFTAFHHRGDQGDALIEFADVRHAKMALDILQGARMGFDSNHRMQVYPWKSEYQAGFVEYFQHPTKASHQLYSPSSRTDDNNDAAGANNKALSHNSAIDWQGVQDLRENVLTLQKENKEYKRQLNKAHDDLGYYHDRFEAERARAHDNARRMEEENYALRQENDRLIRENNDLQQQRRNDSSFSASYNDERKSSWEEELRHSKLKHEELQGQVYSLQDELCKTMKEKELLAKDSKQLKSTVETLMMRSDCVKMENENASQHHQDGLLQQRLEEALSKIEELNQVVTSTHLQLQVLESDKARMNEAFETLEEEMEQMRMNHAMEMGFGSG